jgi:hypothetical protein
MTIAVVSGSEAGSFKDATANATQALGASVSVGDLVVIVACKEIAASDPFVAGDCTKSSGTATIGAVTLDRTVEVNMGNGPPYAAVGIWSCIVTGAGSLTMGVTGSGSADYWGSLAVGAYSGTWDSSRVEAANSASSATDNSNAASGNVTTAGPALLIGGMQSAYSLSTTITEDSPWVLIAESQDGSTHAIGSVIRQIVTGATTDQAGWTISADYGWAAAVVAYKEAGGGSSFKSAWAMNANQGLR